MPRRLAFAASALALALGVTATSAGSATAETDARTPLGATRVAVAPAVLNYLTKAQVQLRTTGDAKAFKYNGTLAVRFPITDVAMNGNQIKHSGGVALSAGGNRITLQRYWINLNRGKVSGVVNANDRVDLFRLAESHRPRLGAVRLVFTRAAARALNKTFGVHHFAPGGNFGFATVNSSN